VGVRLEEGFISVVKEFMVIHKYCICNRERDREGGREGRCTGSVRPSTGKIPLGQQTERDSQLTLKSEDRTQRHDFAVCQIELRRQQGPRTQDIEWEERVGAIRRGIVGQRFIEYTKLVVPCWEDVLLYTYIN